VGELFWRPDGRFVLVDGYRRVQGWSMIAADVGELLRRTGVRSDEVAAMLAAAGVSDVEFSRDAMSAATGLEQDPRDVLAGAAAHCELVLEYLAWIRGEIPDSGPELVSWLAMRAKELNSRAPQVQALRAFEFEHLEDMSDREKRVIPGFARGFDWVDPNRVITTPDRVWNEIDRRGRDEVVETICAAVRDAETEHDRRRWLARFSLEDPVVLDLVPGPAGPVYEVSVNGSHRTHAARILGLPLMLAEVDIGGLPYPTFPCDAWPAPAGQQERIWSQLERRGVFTAIVDENEVWHWSDVHAEWMLLKPALAVETNRAYERIYPGALTELTGLGVDVFTDEDLWVRSLAVVASPAAAEAPASIWRQIRWWRRSRG
jgi:hypothetical protein